MKRPLSIVASYVLSTAVQTAWGSGADALLKTVIPSGGDLKVSAGASEAEMKLSDPFLLQLFAILQSDRDLPGEVQRWSMQILRHDFQGAAHLLSVVEPQVPSRFAASFAAARAYLYWKLDLPRTFFSSWMRVLGAEGQKNRLAEALETVVQPGFDNWLITKAVLLTPEETAVIRKLDAKQSLLYSTLHAWVALRTGEAAKPVLELLPVSHALKAPLARTVTLALAKKKDLGGAGTVLKRHLEPAMEASGNAHELSGHYLQVARLLYQTGAWEAAEQYYSKIPSGSPEYLNAREELTWVWLRTGNLAKLRGELATLSSRVFDERFGPEVYLVRAISNLKLCYFDDVEKDFRQFIENNSRWAKRIDLATRGADPKAPEEKDWFTLRAERAVEAREVEVKRLQDLAMQSVQAALPAVGVQHHWEESRVAVATLLENDKKLRSQEYRRQWKHREVVLREAIRKMQFVKVELLTQLHTLAMEAPAEVPKQERRLAMNALSQEEASDMNFPFDGVVWPDELFRLRSIARGRCPQGRKP